MPCCVRATDHLTPVAGLQQQQVERLFGESTAVWLPIGIRSSSTNPAPAAAVLTGASGHSPTRCLLLHSAGSSNYQKIVTDCIMFG